MGALNALVERAKAKLAADPSMERARYVVPLVCERAAVPSVHPGDVTFTVWEQLEIAVGRDETRIAVVHAKGSAVTFDVDLAPLVANAREELSPPAWDGASSDTPTYIDETRAMIEARARKLIEADDAQPPPRSSRVSRAT